METDDFNECDHHDLQTVGNVFFELEDFETALFWYRKYSEAGNNCGDACVLDGELAVKRLHECETRLSNKKTQ